MTARRLYPTGENIIAKNIVLAARKRLKQPGESDIDAMLRISLTAAAGAFLFMFLRMLIGVAEEFDSFVWPLQTLWWFGFGAFFSLAWAALVAAVFIWIRTERQGK